jgi:prepilin-type N-terminal cleavage/methylation domain-containing protein
MLSNIKKRTEGFTIIEVLIVLAIAGLILLIVFLAVPALQRNSRNTQRKNDVSGILGAVSEFSNNNNGALPAVTDKALVLQNVKLGIYDTTGVTFASGSGTNEANPDKITVVMKAQCSGSDAVSSNSRQFVALYTVEAGSGSTKICQES